MAEMVIDRNDPSALAPKSTLRVRTRPHIHPGRGGEAIVEVVREGEVVGTIYGSREGVQIISKCFEQERRTLWIDVPGGAPGLLVPLLRAGESCPWCGGARKIDAGTGVIDCPVCGERQE